MAKETDIKRITKRYIHRLARSITVNRAILTGSWATGRYLEDSDVDLIIVSDDFSKMQISERLNYLQKKWTNRIPLEAFGYTVAEFRRLRQSSTYVKDAVRNGVVLLKSGSGDPAAEGCGHVDNRGEE
jgi:predicted nucleotidyltransferase